MTACVAPSPRSAMSVAPKDRAHSLSRRIPAQGDHAICAETTRSDHRA
jgi:hypothetical protein